MLTDIGEPITVSAVFRDGDVRPRAFLWRGRRYRIARVLSHYQSARGKFRQDYFNLACGTPDVYEVMLDTEDMSWQLLKIYSEG